jgi:hypothetical protein
MTHTPRRVATVLALLVLAAPTPALAGAPSIPRPLAAAGGRESGPSAPVVIHRAATTQWTFSTRDRRFLPHTSNQGYWGNHAKAEDGNDNYVVGRCCGAGELRDFFTFYLGGLQGTVVSATLVLQKYSGRGGHEKLRFVSTTTPVRKLNDNQGINLRIFKDLGRGTSYGTFRLSTKGAPDSTYSLDLNANALAAIHNHAGEFFSLGGHLLTLRDGGFLFAHSGGRGPQELIVTTSP